MFTTAISSSLKGYLRPLVQPRRFQAYCIGTPKSGTHSIAGLFSPNYRSSHEPEFEFLWNMLLDVHEGLVSQEQFLKQIKARDRRLWLELDSSNLNYYLIDILIKEFDDAKFILTIRDCYSWLASAIKHRISRKRSVANSQRKDKFRFGTCSFEYAKEEDTLKQYQLPTVDAYLAYWAEHNSKVLKKVPQDKLLVVKTNEISPKVERIADFIGISSETLNRGSSHVFRARTQKNILSEIDRDFLEAKVNKHCKKLMDNFFPDLD